jgi:hypothetical protein
MEGSRSFYLSKILPAINKKYQRSRPKRSRTRPFVEVSFDNVSKKRVLSKQKTFIKSTKTLPGGTCKFIDMVTQSNILPPLKPLSCSDYSDQMNKLLTKITV